MPVRRSAVARAVSWVVLSVLLAGCTVGSGVALKPQSHFSYPNSNVTPLGRVTGEASTSGLLPVTYDADLEEEAIQTALKEKGGDILIDYIATTTITAFPLLIITVYTTTVRVDGTAAKMTIGRQQLR